MAKAESTTVDQKKPKKAAPKKTKEVPKKNDIEEKLETKFRFKAKDGTLTSIPTTGKVNVIELRQEDRTDFLFTRLPKELALKYSPGKVRTRYDFTIGDCCVLATKYRGEAIDANKPKVVSECYTVIFCPHFAEINADLELIGEGLSDDDLKHALLALDESKALEFRNKYLVEKELREKGRDFDEKKAAGIRESATRMATTIVDDVALGDRAVEEDVSLFNMGTVGQWLQKNWIFVLLAVLSILFVASMFTGG